ncbi:MAG: S8 family serine peptidase [Eubacteriales bacterium]|jgi:hypothetical protein
MLVAVIDDGIDVGSFAIGELKYDMTVTKWGMVRKRKTSERVETYHGTTVAGIIKKYAPTVELCSVRIFSGGILKTTCKHLISALKWCKRMKIPLVNLSLGTTDPEDFDEVRTIIEQMIGQGQIIVAATNNNGKYTVPASLPGVYGVVADPKLCDDQIGACINPDSEKLIPASSRHQLILPDGNTIITGITNSFAAPTVAAYLIVKETNY